MDGNCSSTVGQPKCILHLGVLSNVITHQLISGLTFNQLYFRFLKNFFFEKMGNIFSSSCIRCCDKYEGFDETNTKNDERSSVDGNQPIESTEYTNLVTMTANTCISLFTLTDHGTWQFYLSYCIVKHIYKLRELATLAKLNILFTICHYHD